MWFFKIFLLSFLLAIAREYQMAFWGSFFLILFSVPRHFTAGNEILKRPKVAIGSFQLLRPCSDRYKRATTNGMPKAFWPAANLPPYLFFFTCLLTA
jgi:hypothetical protein